MRENGWRKEKKVRNGGVGVGVGLRVCVRNGKGHQSHIQALYL